MDHIHTFLTTQEHGGPPQMSDQPNAGHLRDSTNMKDNTHQAHTQSSQQGEYGMMITTAE